MRHKAIFNYIRKEKMKLLRTIILILWFATAVAVVAIPFMPSVSLLFKICAGILGGANILTIFANIKLVKDLNRLQDKEYKEDK